MKLRFLIAGTLVTICSAAAAAQDAPIKFGLWEGTVRQQTTASYATVAKLKKKGQSVPTSFTLPYRKCIDETQWMKTKTTVSVAPQGCAFVRKDIKPTSLITSLECDVPDGTSIRIDSDIEWEAGVKTHATNRMTTIYPGSTGKVVVELRSESHFLGSDCGTIPPGRSEPLD